MSVCMSVKSFICLSYNHLTSLSLCESHIPSVCHTIIPTSPSVCQLQNSSVCQPTRDVTRTTIWPTVCPLSVTSILPSANSTVKMPMSIPVQNFLHALNLGKLPSSCTSMDSSVHHTGSPSISSSPPAAYLLKFPCNYGEKDMVNYLHKNPVKSPSISTLYVMPFGAPVHASSIQSICTLCIMSVIAPVHELSIQPVQPRSLLVTGRPSCMTYRP